MILTTNLALIDRTIVWSETCKEQNIKQLLATEKNKEINKPGLCHHNSSYFLIIVPMSLNLCIMHVSFLKYYLIY